MKIRRLWAISKTSMLGFVLVLGLLVQGCSGDDDDGSGNSGVNSELCGNGVVDPGEECDGMDLGGITRCENLGYQAGTVTCTAQCKYDLSECEAVGRCGDGIIQQDAGEECDLSELGGKTCKDFGYSGGTLKCAPDCTFNLGECGDGGGSEGNCGNGVVDPGEECDDGNDVAWDGCNECHVSEFQVNTYTTGNQYYPRVAMDSTGRFVVVWQSYDQDGSEWGIYGQRYDADGNPVGSEFQVNTYTTDVQSAPQVAMDSTGRFVVVWQSYDQDGDRFGVYGQRYDADGNPVGSEFLVNTTTENLQKVPSVAMAPDGRFVVVWQSYAQDGSNGGIYGQLYDADGNPVGAEFQVNTTVSGDQEAPNVAMGPDGSFVVVWQGDQNGYQYDIYGQMFDANGSPVGSEFLINSYTGGDQTLPRVAVDDTGRFVVVWQSDGQEGSIIDNIYGQIFDADSNPVGGEFSVNDYTDGDQSHPDVAMDGTGRFAIVWASIYDGTTDGIYVKRYNADGSVLNSEFRVNTYDAYSQSSPAVTMGPDGRFVVVWNSDEQDGSNAGVFAQHFTSDGTPLGSLPMP